MAKHIRLVLLITVFVALGSRFAFAGPPLVCFPFDIGAAKTLPMAGADWRATDPRYDVSRLADDTLAILTADTPVLVRMETIRRAAIYASTNPAQAAALVARLEARAKAPGVNPIAIFDYGYAVETFRQARSLFKNTLPVSDRVNGYQLVRKAFGARPEPEIEFAAAVITQDGGNASEHRAHLQRAAAGAKEGSTLAANLRSHFGGKTLEELRRH